MTAFYILVMGSYLLLLLALMRGWNKVISLPIESTTSEKFISVLVPFRNEAHNIQKLMDSVKGLNYPSDKFEVILINDHSEDNSVNVVQTFINEGNNYLQIELSGDAMGKKEALAFGVTSAQGEIVATTDADCELPINWLNRISEAFQHENVKMVFGGVKLGTPKSFFSKLQAIEFASLIGSGAATLSLGFFTMCNGANLAFRKSAFHLVEGYKGNLKVPSGDDEFLARKILNQFPGSLRFLNSKDAVVNSQPSSSLKGFFYQRLRWASKWRHSTSLLSKLLAIYILIVQITFISLMASFILQKVELYLIISLIGVKILLEFGFLHAVSRFLKSKWSWGAFLLWQFIYPLYVIAIGVVSQGTSFKWKGRRLSHKM